jgi:hypothetical protein
MSAERERPPLPRFLPSPTALFVAVLAVLLVCIAIARGLQDPDYFWHVTTGRYIATNGIPSIDPFSFTWAGKPWTLHEWLSELALFHVVRLTGDLGAETLVGLVGAATFAVLAWLLRRSGVRPLAVVAVCALSGWVLVPFLTVRPQAVSWLLLSGLLMVLMLLTDERPSRSLLLIPFFVVWANLHGLWVIGLGIVALYAFFTVIGRTPMRGARSWMIGALLGVALAVMATPAGPEGILYPLRYIQPGNWGLANIVEWQSPNFHDPANLGFLALVLAVAINGGRATPGWLVAASVIGIALGLGSIRNEPIAAILAVPTLGLGLEARIMERRGPHRPAPARLAFGRRVLELSLAAVVSVGGALLILPRSPIHAVPNVASAYPAIAVDTLLKMKPNVHVIAEYGWGGYVISRIYDSGGRVFVDGRNDMYSEQILDDYSTIRDINGDWVGLTRKYGVEAMLFPPNATIVKGAATSAGWCEAYHDSKSVLLVKDCALLIRR